MKAIKNKIKENKNFIIFYNHQFSTGIQSNLH